MRYLSLLNEIWSCAHFAISWACKRQGESKGNNFLFISENRSSMIEHLAVVQLGHEDFLKPISGLESAGVTAGMCSKNGLGILMNSERFMPKEKSVA